MPFFFRHKEPFAGRCRSISATMIVGALAGLMAGSTGAGAAEMSPGDSTLLTQTDFRLLDEVRLGAAAHDLEAKESGQIDISLEFLSSPLPVSTGYGVADFILGPRLHVGANLNTAGDTSYLYTGFTWDFDFTDSVFLEVSLGGAVNNGKDATPGRIDMGCRVTFREAANLGYRFNEHWLMLVGVEHLSHAGLCDGANEGLTNAGVRVGYRF